MNLTKLLKGKKIKVMTNVGVAVELEVASVKEESHSRDLEPATRENDWWPRSENWTTIEVKFTNGHTESYSSLSDIDIVD